MEATGLYDSFPHATIVYAKYCDGSSFTGDVSEPVKVQVNATYTSVIYYRGRRNFDALFDNLFAAQGLDKASELLFAGCSAGALTTYVHADYVTSLMAARGRGTAAMAPWLCEARVIKCEGDALEQSQKLSLVGRHPPKKLQTNSFNQSSAKR